MLAEAFTDAVNVAVGEKVPLEVQNALQVLDGEHAQKLEKLLESIDEDHTRKLQVVLEKIDQDHAQKLQQVIDYYKRVITEDAQVFKKELVDKLSDYIDLYIGEKIPQQEIEEAVKNVTARKIVDQIKQIVAVDEEFVNETIKEAVDDGKKTIDALRKELNDAVKMNITISQEKKNAEAQLVFEKKTAGFPKEKKEFVLRILKDKGPDVIEENFDYVIKMFEKQEEEKKQVITEDAKKNSRVVAGKVDVPASAIKDSTLVTESNGDSVGGYLQQLEKQDKRF